MTHPHRGDLLPSLAIAVGAACWGLYRIPLRGIEQTGVHAFWIGSVIFGASLLLLMVEVIVGVASAAILTEDQFGVRELAGTVLIISAGVVEVLRQQKIDRSGIVNPQLPPYDKDGI